MNQQFIRGLTIDWDKIAQCSYLRKIEAINGLEHLEFKKPITFLVGENVTPSLSASVAEYSLTLISILGIATE